jgi:hypothetical protein
MDQVVTGEVRVAFYDSSSRTNKAMQLAIAATTPVSATTGTNKSMRILSEST